MENQVNNNNSNNNAWMKIALIVLCLTTLLLAGYIIYERISGNTTKTNGEGTSNTQETTDNEGTSTTTTNNGGTSTTTTNNESTSTPATFSATAESGTLEVTGYAEKVAKLTGATGTETVDYIYFYVVGTNSNEIYTYINNHSGNAFFKTNAIGLGCLDNNKIHYWNASDANGEKKYELSAEDTAKIMNSTSANPIKLELTKMPYSSAKGAPTCTSMMTTIKVK